METNGVINTVNRILKKNYFILTSLASEGKTTASRSDLQKKGFRFDYFTYSCVTRSNKVYYYCYDHGYREQDNDKVTIVKQAANLNQSQL